MKLKPYSCFDDDQSFGEFGIAFVDLCYSNNWTPLVAAKALPCYLGQEALLLWIEIDPFTRYNNLGKTFKILSEKILCQASLKRGLLMPHHLGQDDKIKIAHQINTAEFFISLNMYLDKMLADAETYQPTGVRWITKKMSSLLSKDPIMVNAVMDENDFQEVPVNPDLAEMTKEYQNIFDFFTTTEEKLTKERQNAGVSSCVVNFTNYGTDSESPANESPSSESGEDSEIEDKQSQKGDPSKEEGEISDESPSSAHSSDDDNPRKEDEFDPEYPRKTSKLTGIITTTAHEHLMPEHANAILEMAAVDNRLCAGTFPKVYSDGGTILVYNCYEIQQKYGFKTIEEAQKEVRCDGYSYDDSTGAKVNKDFKITINHYKAKDYRTKKYNAKAPFDRWTYASENKHFILVHYIGCSDYIADGLPHGNAKTNKKYIRSCRSLIKQEMDGSKDMKPAALLKKLRNQVTKEIREEGLDPRVANVKKPRGIAQVQDARKRLLNEARLSHDTYINCSELGLRLRFDDYRKGDIPRSFIPVLGLSETNLFCYFEHPALIEEMGRVIKETGIVGKLFYDTKFKSGDYYLSLLSFEHPYFERQILIAGYIHDRKTHSKHMQFLRTFWERNKKVLKGGRYVIITDGEFTFTDLWRGLKQIYCFLHLKQDLKRKLKKNIEKEICLLLFEELQQETTSDGYDEKLENCLAILENDKAKQLFKYYGDKMKERSSAWACREASLSENRMTDNPGESMNAYVDNLVPKEGDMEADLMLIFLFELTEDFRNKIHEGYYNCSSDFKLTDEYADKARGTPKEITAGTYSPPFEEIAKFVMDKSALPLKPNAEHTGKLVRKESTFKPGLWNQMAKDLVDRKRVLKITSTKFLVTDLADIDEAVRINDRDLSKQKFFCSCRSKQICIHLRAVFLFLHLDTADIPYFNNAGTILEERKKQRKRNEKKSGVKAPRRVDQSKRKDYDSDADDGDDEDDGHQKKSKQLDNGSDDDNVPSDTRDNGDESKKPGKRPNKDEIEKNPKKKKIESDSSNENDGNFMKSFDEIDKEEKARGKTKEEKELEKLAKKAEDELRSFVQKRYTDAKQPFAKPSKTVEADAQWTQITSDLEAVLFYPEIFKPDFHEVLPVLPVKKALVFVTSREDYAICYKISEDVLAVYATSNDLLVNTPEEMAFTAAHAARGKGKTVKVSVYGGSDIHKNANPLVIVALKLLTLINSEDPSEYYFEIPDDTQLQIDSILQIHDSKIKGDGFIYMNQKKMSFYCCCNRSFFAATPGQNNFLKIPSTVQCHDKKCKNHYFFPCVNYSAGKSKETWYCYKCAYTYSLPSWGTGAINTCPLNNFLAMCCLVQQRDSTFFKIITSNSNFEKELIRFLKTMGKSTHTIDKAQEDFIKNVYKGRDDLHGSEYKVVYKTLENFVCGTKIFYKCDTCGGTEEGPPLLTTNVRKGTEGDSVPEKIQSIFELKNVYDPGRRCKTVVDDISGEKCNEKMICEKAEYVQEYPWCIVIGTSTQDQNRRFGLTELEYLPSTVQYKEKQYILGGISLHITNHFISILPTEGGYVLYDGIKSNHPKNSLPEILKLAAKEKPLIGKIVYFLNPKQKGTKTRK